MWTRRAAVLALAPGLALGAAVGTDAKPRPDEPVAHVYSSPGGVDLKAYVFPPAPGPSSSPRPAIALLHGGGWSMGEASWAFGLARHLAERGLVAVAVQYRLSNQDDITPLEAMADARAAIRWMRAQEDALGIDPGRIAAWGWSAGGHLAASTAIFGGPPGEVSAVPNALVLVSPAVALEEDGWVRRLLGDRADPRDISPVAHTRAGLPPTLILQGDVDTVTPLAGARRFCEGLLAAGSPCTLKVYEGYGHVFTPAGIPDDWPKPDPAIRADAWATADEFLEEHGFMR